MPASRGLNVARSKLLTTSNDKQGIELDYSQLVKLLGGLDLRTGRRRKRYRRVV